MSWMSELDVEMQRLSDLDMAVRNYLSHLYAVEQGADEDSGSVDYWRDRLEMLTDGEPWEVK